MDIRSIKNLGNNKMTEANPSRLEELNWFQHLTHGKTELYYFHSSLSIWKSVHRK